jgi:DNA repair exonuclease SbcCD nuclease subunit
LKKRIAHLADIHIARSPLRHAEYQQVFSRTARLLQSEAPDVIVLTGDLFNDYIAASNESTQLAGNFLRSLSAIAPVVLTRGNHDYDKFRQNRIDSVKPVVDLLATDQLRYFNKSGFYRDDNLIWVVWHHGDELSPWNVALTARKQGYPADFYADDIEQLLNQYGDFDGVRAAGYTLIDLFHDPVTGAKASNGEVFRDGAYLRQSDLQGDYALLGDIHLRQFFTRPGQHQPFAGYPGSLIQLHFGEAETGHGYLLWDIEADTVRAVDVPNDVCYYTVVVEPGTEYDALSLVLPEPTAPVPHVRIYWRDNSLQQTQANKTKLRKYFRERYAADVTFDPHPVDQRQLQAGRVGTDLDQLDLTDAGLQRTLITEYLESNAIPQEQIVSLLELDDTITERLRIADSSEDGNLLSGDSNGEVRLLNLRIDNFQSVDELTLDLQAHPGLWQITGPNETGKTTVPMALLYLKFGNTLGTVVLKNGEIKTRPEKNGDNRFINNKRDKDYCQVSADFEVAGILVRATRRSERKWKRTKADEPRQISKVSTDYRLELLTSDFQVDQDVSVDKRRRTERLATQAFGTFDDFLRQSFFSADTMSGLLSLDRAVFIDTLLRDLRLDQYERKLKVFREWKTEVGKRQTRLVLDQAIEEGKLRATEASLVEARAQLLTLQQRQLALTSALSRGQQQQASLHQQFQPMPVEVGDTPEQVLRQQVHDALASVHAHGTKEQDLLVRCQQLPATYDEVRYQSLRAQVDDSQGWVRSQELEIERLGNQVDAHLNSIVHLKGMLALTKEKADAVKKRYERDVQALEAELLRQDREISQLEQSTVCPTCQQPKSAAAVAAIEQEVSRRRTARGLHEQRQRAELLAARDQELDGMRESYRSYQQQLTVQQEPKQQLVDQQQALRAGITARQLEYADMGQELASLDKVRLDVERRRELELSGARFPLIREELELLVRQSRERLAIFEQAEKVRKDNQKVREQLAQLAQRQQEQQSELRQVETECIRLEQAFIPRQEQEQTQLTDRLLKYGEQQQREHVWSIYEKCMSREGLPMQLLRRALGPINEQMAELLEGLCFTIYLDEDLEFRMLDHRVAGVDQHILQGSGMERTFASLVLRLGLRRLNHRARWNILIMDELLGKLDAEATVRYAELLRTATMSIEHVFVIEHHGEGILRPDHLLKVHAYKGVSKYQLSLN